MNCASFYYRVFIDFVLKMRRGKSETTKHIWVLNTVFQIYEKTWKNLSIHITGIHLSSLDTTDNYYKTAACFFFLLLLWIPLIIGQWDA